MIFSLNTLPRHPPSLQEACPASPLTTKRHSHICGRFARPTCNITIPTRTFLSAKKIPRAFGWFRLALYPVHGKLHGKFSATSLHHNAVRASVVPEALSFASPIYSYQNSTRLGLALLLGLHLGLHLGDLNRLFRLLWFWNRLLSHLRSWFCARDGFGYRRGIIVVKHFGFLS